MNLLIVGGLFILGILALVALVFVIRNEPSPIESPNVPTPLPTPQAEPVTSPPPVSKNTTAPVTEKPALLHKWQLLPDYEFANELRTLHKQVQELEQRLSTMIDVIERIDQNAKGNFPVEDQKTLL